MAVNTAFFPTLMWNSRFASLSGDPFDNSGGLIFPAPEGLSLSYLPHLLDAQAFIPPTERVEVAGFVFPQDPDAAIDHDNIRAEVLQRLNGVPEYRKLFGKNFPSVKAGGPITFEKFGRAIAEFEFSLVFANAPLDQFARGQKNAMTDSQKKGALLFFREGRLRRVPCRRRQIERDVQRFQAAHHRSATDRSHIRQCRVRRPGVQMRISAWSRSRLNATDR